MTSRMWKSYIIKILHEEWESENYKFCTEIQIIGIYALEVLLAKFFSQKKKDRQKRVPSIGSVIISNFFIFKLHSLELSQSLIRMQSYHGTYTKNILIS